ncbi:NeuD/PglB/VioB family sugar acetyltransferase [Algiphilus sp. NNCM1]|uniref:NeuD/PglB/VioB family sugar acetyltransferase n=1 Tax=Algiphilus sp. TaxID=1872431 RepID=UPI001CA7304F|nr:NeuD/PglB/VioB family sugar acetyltransferase [Algiphilus sp.]MBY8965058.1 NeuD/PglB/VioB family sugar acetyltransferase [Algiphilus acroporae]MCI5104211.1 NeuD/PglB/VioB family sugar acetyltransferase [Algiphilus sp.]
MSRTLAVFGASGCGRGVMPLVGGQCGVVDDCERVFVDDAPSTEFVNGYRVLSYEQWLSEGAENRQITLAIADGFVRERLAHRCKRDGVGFFQVRASNVVELDDVQIGEGAILCPFVTLTSNIRIGRHFHANLYSYVEHDCVIGDYVTFAPAVRCNGNVVIEDHAYIGAGAILRQGRPGEPLVIGRGAVVGMGAVVTKSVPEGATVVGNPARVLDRSDAGS